MQETPTFHSEKRFQIEAMACEPILQAALEYKRRGYLPGINGMNNDSFDKTSLSLCWCRYVQILPVALLWENKLECLIMKSIRTTRIFYLQGNYDGTIPH